MRLPDPALVVLVGPSGAGKSTWAATHFREDQVVSSDRIRALVGQGEHDQRAGKDAFDVLDLVLDRRLRRGLLTVVDTLGLDAKRRRAYVDLARTHGVPCHAVLFTVDADVGRARNKKRDRAVPANVLAAQLRSAPTSLDGEGFHAVHPPDDHVHIVPADMYDAPALARRQKEQPVSLRFGLQIPRFTWEGGAAATRDRLAAVARTAEDAGFSSIWVMDHFLQIPPVGREWEDMLDSYTTLGYLAAHTSTATLGTLVTGITYRNVAHLAKIVATLDVLSGGRAVCGVGAAWFEREHKLYGWPFPPRKERYVLLEDALQLLPVMWGKGSPPFDGAVLNVPETICYPRPLQDHVPILVGGGGERRTLKLVAQYADACNLFGDADTVRHKLAVLARHCADAGRPLDAIEVTHLSTAADAPVDDHIGRLRGLADAGVQTAIVSFPALNDTSPIERFAPVIAAFA